MFKFILVDFFWHNILRKVVAFGFEIHLTPDVPTS